MKFRKFMTAVTLAGIFLTGIGAGIGFVEFCGFEYQGTVVLGEENREETRLVWELGDEKFTSLRPYVADRSTEDITVEKDTKVPEDEVWLDVAYNSAWGKPDLVSYTENVEEWTYEDRTYIGEYMEQVPDGAEDKTGEKLGYAEIWTNHSLDGAEEAEILMKIKDQILKELKEKKFSTYSNPRIFSVKVRVNPSNYKRLEIMNG